MEGLEVTIYNKSEIIIDNDEFRIDSEYYKTEYLELYKQINGSAMLGDLTYMSDLSSNGSFAVVASIKNDNNPKTVSFIRSGNVGATFIKEEDLEFISKEAHINLPKSTTQLHEIMMARKGKIGGASIIMEDQVGFNCNENVIKLRILDKSKLNPFYFTAYFNSKFGIKQIERLSTGNVQPWVSIFQIRKLMIPILDFNFQTEIEKIIVGSHNCSTKAKISYNKAENLLLAEVGLQDFAPSTEGINVKTLSESFGISGRLDAEYYQPKYDEIETKILEHEHIKLNDAILRIETGEYSPVYYKRNERDGLSFYIRSTNIKEGQIEFDDNHYVPKSNFKRIAIEGDIITARVGSLGVFGEVRKEMTGSIYSDNVLNFKLPSIYIPSVYTLLFNTKFYFELIDRLARGSVQQRLNQETLKDLFIPIIDIAKQEEIAALIEESFSLKKQSEHLLEVAKRGVELAIEENEAVAMAYIKEETDGE